MKIRENVSEIRRLFHERKEANLALLNFLISKGISSCIARKIISEVEGKEIVSVSEVIANRLHVAGELNFALPQKLAFVGPTGVGKTTTLLKLAELYLKQDKKVALMSLDETKKGFLKEWAEAGKIPFIELHQSCAADLVLIDTEGCNFYLPDRIENLGEKLSQLGEEVEIVLTLSAAAKEVDLYGAIHQFSPLNPNSLCFTKMDETLASGVVINVSDKTTIPIRYIANGYPLPGEIELADAKFITHKVLTDFNNEDFQFLRHLSI